MNAHTFAALVRERVPVVGVQITATLRTGIDAQFQRAVWSLADVLDNGLERNDRTRAHVHGKCLHRRIHFNDLSAGLSSASPEVEPVPLGQRDVIVPHKTPDSGSDQQAAAEHELFAIGSQLRTIGKLEEHRAHQRNAGAGILFHAGVNVRQQAIASLYITLANALVFRPVHPGLAVTRLFSGVGAINRIEGAKFHPARQQLRRRAAIEAADIRSHKTVA